MASNGETPVSPKTKTLKEEETSSKGLQGAVVACIFAILVGVLGYLYHEDHFGEQKVMKALGIVEKKENFGEPGVIRSEQDAIPPSPFSFTVHFNGDGLSEGLVINTQDVSGLDDVIRTTCLQLIKDDDIIIPEQCEPSNGARLFTHFGIRCYSLLDIEPGTRTYIVPQGTLFVWPLGKVGDVIYPKCVKSPVPGKPIKLTQLSMSPRVFSVENFMTVEETDKLISHNEPLVKPSEVGFAGWRDDTRTSSTSWDSTSWAAKDIQKRAFDIVSMEYEPHTKADSVQVLRYENTEWYKPHVDWFDGQGYDGHDPTVNNGTNRFVTVFLYISDVEEGGHTVFPLSTTHEGYNGEQLVHKGTDNTAGYIANKDARWVCNTSSTALRSTPKRGNAVIFYSQGPRSELDKYSLHGGCPVIKGTKWSANVWIWNRPKPDKSAAKDGENKKKSPTPGSITVRFVNDKEFDLKVYWDDGSHEMIFQLDLAPGQQGPMNTYQGHRFVAKTVDGEYVGEYRGDPSDDEDAVFFK